MKNRWIIAIILGFGLLFNSCEEFIEKDISDQWVYGLSPTDFSVTDILTPTLKWKEVKGATSYNLQVFGMTDSTYTRIKEFIVDTNLRTTQFTVTLRSGYYAWHIYGKNNGGETGLSVFRFQIDSTADITKQKIILISPGNGKILDNPEVEFTWKGLPSATAYNVQIYPKDETKAIYSEVIVNATTTKFVFDKKKASYTWRVNAMNGNLNSPYTEYALTIDTSRLQVPVVTFPKNDTTTINKLPVQLRWSGVTNAEGYTVQIAKDSTIVDETKKVTDVFYDYTNAVKSTRYYWRVKSYNGKSESKYSKWWYFMYK